MARRGTRRGPPQVTSLGGCCRTAAYGVRSVRHGYMLTTPAAGRGWQRDGAGGTPGAAAPARAGAGGADALVENQARTRIHVTPCTLLRRWRRTRADAAVVPVRTGAGAAAPVEDRGRRTSRGPQAESVSRQRCGRNTTSDGRDLRWTGTTCRASSLDCPDGARREMPVGRGWNGLKAETHGGPGRAGPRTKLCRWRAYAVGALGTPQ
jgi:hypothetical protein